MSGATSISTKVRGASVRAGAINELIDTGADQKILAKWDVTSSGITASRVNPPATL